MHTPIIPPIIACSSRISTDAATLIAFAENNGFHGIEYSIKSETKEDLAKEIANIVQLGKSNVEIRYHTPFQDLELAHSDVSKAKKSALFMKQCIDIAEDNGVEYITVHLGLGYRFALQTLNRDNAVKYLSDVSYYAQKKNVVICLENLTYGWTNNPDEMKNIVEETGVNVTIDIGHVAASQIVVNNTMSASEFIKILSNHILGSHIYKIEIFDTDINQPVHIAPITKSDISTSVSELMTTRCNWWLVELGNKSDVIHTRNILSEILSHT